MLLHEPLVVLRVECRTGGFLIEAADKRFQRAIAQHREPGGHRGSRIGCAQAHLRVRCFNEEGKLDVAALQRAEIGALGNGVLHDARPDIKRTAYLVKEVALHHARLVVRHLQQCGNTDPLAHLVRAQEADVDSIMDEAAVKVLDKRGDGAAALRRHDLQASSAHIKRLVARGDNVARRVDGVELKLPPAASKPREGYDEEAHPRRVPRVERREGHFAVGQRTVGEDLAQRQRVGHIAIRERVGGNACT